MQITHSVGLSGKILGCGCNGLGDAIQDAKEACVAKQGSWDESTLSCASNLQNMSTGGKIAVGAVVVGLVGLLGYVIWSKTKMMQTVAEKEGSSGVLKMEAGEAAIGLAGALGARLARKNARRYARQKARK